jgi:hypothetical protein
MGRFVQVDNTALQRGSLPLHVPFAERCFPESVTVGNEVLQSTGFTITMELTNGRLRESAQFDTGGYRVVVATRQPFPS